jgi:hypothetical protein
MRIKYTKDDPRAGSVAEVNSFRGEQLIKEGAAVKVGRDDEGDPQTSPAKQLANATKSVRKAAAKKTAK